MQTFSNRILTDTTKTGEIHRFECVDDFIPYIKRMPKTLSPFFFVNPYGRKSGGYYSLKTMGDIWKKACKQVDENITMCAGLKHSSCCQYLNEA